MGNITPDGLLLLSMVVRFKEVLTHYSSLTIILVNFNKWSLGGEVCSVQNAVLRTTKPVTSV